MSKKGTFFKKRLIIRKKEGPFFGKKGIILVKKVSFDLEIGFFVAFTLVKTRPHFEKYRGIILKKKVPTQTYQSPDGIILMLKEYLILSSTMVKRKQNLGATFTASTYYFS